MESLIKILSMVVAPFAIPLFPGQRVYWVYLLSALFLALCVYLAKKAPAHRASLREFLRFCFDRRIYSRRSVLIDCLVFAINPLAITAGLAILYMDSVLISSAVQGLAGSLFGGTGPGWQADGLSAILFSLCFILAWDAGQYANHYLHHKVPVLWELHKVHHSAEVLVPITAYRFHPLEVVITTNIVGCFTGVIHGVFAYLYPDGAGELTVLGLNAVLFGFYFVGNNLRHSHIWIGYPKAVSHIFVSPAMHQIHHSDAPRHYDKNMGVIFAIWDHLFGTIYVPETEEKLSFGLADLEHKEFESVWNVYIRPLKRIARRLAAGGPSGPHRNSPTQP